MTSKDSERPLLVHVSGALFTDPESGATIDANRLLADYKRLQQEDQKLRAQLSKHLPAVGLSEVQVELVNQTLELFKLNFEEFKREHAVLIRELDDLASSSLGYSFTFLAEQTEHLKKALVFNVTNFQPNDDNDELVLNESTLLDVVRRYYAIREGVKDSSSDFADQTDAMALYLSNLANYGEVAARVYPWVAQNIGNPSSSALALWNHGLDSGEALAREGVWRKQAVICTQAKSVTEGIAPVSPASPSFNM